MMLVDAVCTNPNCRTIYGELVDDSATVAKCPVCSQFNSITKRYLVGDGRCVHCNKPFDDHYDLVACPDKKGKKS